MRKLVAFLITGLLINTCFSQQDITLKNIIPPSPEASAFIKQGKYQVGTYTGRPDISIPVFEISTNSLSVPISLSYDASGVRVNDMATWVGMNWSLNAGGMVSQVVVGEPDRMNTSIYDVAPRASEIVNNTTYFNYFRSLVENDLYPSNPDAEPDKFYYSLPNGKSGSFVLDRNRNVLQIPKTSLKISIIGSLNGFIITDESGTVYVFSIPENTESFIYHASGHFPDAKNNPFTSTNRNQKTAYYLSEIISSDGNDHIYFTYENETTSSNDDGYTETWGNKYPGYPEPQFPVSNYHGYRWNGVTRVILIPRLKTINFSNGKVEFTRIAGRLDDQITASRLDEISIFQKTGASTYTKLKSFKFAHGYYYSSDSFSPNSGFPQNSNTVNNRYRLRLDSIKLKDAAGSPVSNYSFSYNSMNLPPKTSCAQDWYGYYNGASANTTLVSTTTVYDQGVVPVTIGGADRSSNETYMKAGILEKITYPTGGYTVFDLESHKLHREYSWVGVYASAYAQGNTSTNLTVQTISVPAIPQYQQGSGSVSVTIGPTTNAPQPFVKIKNMTTGVEQTFTNPYTGQFYSFTQSYEFQAGVTYQLTASSYENQSNAMANISISFKKSIYDPHLEVVGGLRIKSVKNYSSNNALSFEESYKYGLNENGSGVLVAGTSPVGYSYGRRWMIWAISGCRSPGDYYQTFTAGPLFDQCLAMGSPVVYTDVTKYYGTSSDNTGKTVFHYGGESQQWVESMPLPSTNLLANNQGIIIINDAWKRGKLLKQSEYKKNPNGSSPLYTLVQQVENIYNKITTDTTYGLFAQAIFDRLIIHNECPYQRDFLDYNWAEYPVRTGYVQLAQTVTKAYPSGSSDFVQTVVDHLYDNTRKDIEIKTTTTNSKGQVLEAERKFPFNKSQLITAITPAESTALDDMVTKNMLFAVEEITRNNSTQTGLKKTSFEYTTGSTIAPVNVKYQVGANPLETRLQFTKYDASGNLVEQRKSNDVITSYLWGYGGTVPVVQVVGADYLTISGMISPSVLSDINPDPATLRSQLNSIRTGLANAQVTTYTYIPVIGLSSVTDPNNRTSYHEYDAFSRLSLIRDQDNNIVKKICYNYAGQPEDCGFTIFSSVQKTGVFTRNNCPYGYAGTSVTYTVPSGTYTSIVSQGAADQLAQNDVDANGQAYANNSANGACNQLCSFTMRSGYNATYNNISKSGGTVTFNLAFYPASGTMYMYGTYNVALITGGCGPSSTKTLTINSGGRTFYVTIYASGDVDVQVTGGSDVPQYNTVSLSGSYTIP